MLNELEWLLKLIQENPDLPIIPIVSDEVIEPNSNAKLVSSNRWMGSVGDAEISMYIKCKGHIRLYGDCDYIETLLDCNKYTREECEKLNDEQLENEYNNLPWEKGIFVNIDWMED